MNSWDDVEFSQSHWALSQMMGPVVAKLAAMVWRWGDDRNALSALVGRYSAHLAVLVLAVVIALFGRITLTPMSLAEAPVTGSQPAVAELMVTPTYAPVTTSPAEWEVVAQSRRAVFRQAALHTEIPERERLQVITYTIQPGDNIFTIAEYFGLSPYTIAWANNEQLQGAPWLVQPGLTLFIPPVDGVYHTVAEGETPDLIAAQYEVEVSALYNLWNSIEPDQPLPTGAMLVIPGGTGGDVEWEAPPPVVTPSRPGLASASASWGACGDVNVVGPGASGWFILPTGSPAVSGWYFHDSRNPGHIGLDYRCHLGDPIYAADNGVVIFAGWGGGYGNLVRVSHGNGYQTYYAHFDSFAVGCGQSVYQGQLLGYCGTTGWSTGPHLHYEIRLNGVPQDPQLYE